MKDEAGQETPKQVSSWPETKSPRLSESLNYSGLLESFLSTHQEKRLPNETEKLAFFDDKTGLLNRRFFYMFAERMQRRGESFGLMIMDIDLLKAYNTYFGEPQGRRYAD